jgi:hypothetical protein
MIQQSIAYAIHTSHAGSIGTVCNVYSGSSSLSALSANLIGVNADLADRGSKGFIGASVGLNIPSLGFELTRGANARIDAVYGRVLQQAQSFLDEWNDLALSYYRQYNQACRTRLDDALTMFEQVTEKAYGFLEKVANEHLARVAEQLDTLTGAKEWFDGTLMTADELKQIAIRVDIEREASETNFDDYEAEVLDGIVGGTTEWDDKIQVALNDVQDCEYRYSMLIQQLFSSLFSDVRTFVTSLCDELSKTIEDVCAYRNIKPSVDIEVMDTLGAFEHSPETEVYRSPRKAVADCIPITVVYDCNKPRGLTWDTAPIPEIESDVTTLPTIDISPVPLDIVVLAYDRLRDVPWSDAGNC